MWPNLFLVNLRTQPHRTSVSQKASGRRQRRLNDGPSWRARQVFQAEAVLDHACRAVVEPRDPVGGLAVHAVVLPIGLQSARRSGQCDPSPAAIRAHAAWDAGHVGDLKSTHLAVLEDAVQRFVILRRSSTAHSLSLNQ
eukprot:COSAG06_NODE_38977_length_417_cov_1.459119_1_plen_138_part_11